MSHSASGPGSIICDKVSDARPDRTLALSATAEYPLHQSCEPIRPVATTDPRPFERYWFTTRDETGEFFIITGIGQNPNLGRTDAYAVTVRHGEQTTAGHGGRSVSTGRIWQSGH